MYCKAGDRAKGGLGFWQTSKHPEFFQGAGAERNPRITLLTWRDESPSPADLNLSKCTGSHLEHCPRDVPDTWTARRQLSKLCQSSVFSVCMYDASASVLGRWAEVFSNHSHDILWTKSGSKQFLSSTVSLTPRSAGAYHSRGRRGTRAESTVTRGLAYYQLLL